MDYDRLSPRRIALWLVGTLLLAAAVAPVLLLTPPARDGRVGLARYKAWTTGELSVTDEYAASLEAGFVTTVRDDGATVYGSAGDDGVCWRLIVTDGAPVGPTPDASGDACRR